MQVNNETLIITDPCYILDEKDFDNYTNCYKDSFIQDLGFTNFIIGDTLIGDWSNKVTMNGKVIGEFGADSGMFIVCTEKDLLNYAKDKEKMKEYIEKCKRNLAVVPNFTGEVYTEIKNDVIIIKGRNNGEVIFSTIEFEDDEEEDKEEFAEKLKEIENKTSKIPEKDINELLAEVDRTIAEYEKKYGKI